MNDGQALDHPEVTGVNSPNDIGELPQPFANIRISPYSWNESFNKNEPLSPNSAQGALRKQLISITQEAMLPWRAKIDAPPVCDDVDDFKMSPMIDSRRPPNRYLSACRWQDVTQSRSPHSGSLTSVVPRRVANTRHNLIPRHAFRRSTQPFGVVHQAIMTKEFVSGRYCDETMLHQKLRQLFPNASGDDIGVRFSRGKWNLDLPRSLTPEERNLFRSSSGPGHYASIRQVSRETRRG
ncbi:uncharacterized protein CLUP02_13423 [Colletotrichum lupini]|uniref:Uncharacterized protein n=1 Tax=Colletotrichum lupini TaxID=145971 RepID=A0A9Q8T430_9PEZI|nr:uncharacterized protein CLUP02_13423 [Colletotrichum lupini]UQC87902.1 hypothetical protein CLUP02_13423 [Colletotrichum lupini]